MRLPTIRDDPAGARRLFESHRCAAMRDLSRPVEDGQTEPLPAIAPQNVSGEIEEERQVHVCGEAGLLLICALSFIIGRPPVAAIQHIAVVSNHELCAKEYVPRNHHKQRVARHMG